jgi:hypothetical protein
LTAFFCSGFRSGDMLQIVVAPDGCRKGATAVFAQKKNPHD